MISHNHLSSRLQKEWHTLEIEEGSKTDFIRGIVRGLKLANALSMELWNQSKDRPHPNQGGNRISYLDAIRTAHRQLKSYERHRAIQTLERVIDRVEAEKRKKNERPML